MCDGQIERTSHKPEKFIPEEPPDFTLAYFHESNGQGR